MRSNLQVLRTLTEVTPRNANIACPHATCNAKQTLSVIVPKQYDGSFY
jgi:hypothetical protein